MGGVGRQLLGNRREGRRDRQLLPRRSDCDRHSGDRGEAADADDADDAGSGGKGDKASPCRVDWVDCVASIFPPGGNYVIIANGKIKL